MGVAIGVAVSIAAFSALILSNPVGNTQPQLVPDKQEQTLADISEDMLMDVSKIRNFFSEKRGNNLLLTVVTRGDIPRDIENFALSESALGFGYAWLGQDFVGVEHEMTGPNHLAGYIANIHPGVFDSASEGWHTEQVNIMLLARGSEFCMDDIKLIPTDVSITANTLSVITPVGSNLFGVANAMSFEMVDNDLCHTGFGGIILDQQQSR